MSINQHSAINHHGAAITMGTEHDSPADVTVQYQLTAGGPTSTYTCSLGVALGIVARPAIGVETMRIKGKLEQHPAIVGLVDREQGLKDILGGLVARLNRLHPYGDDKRDGGWRWTAKDCAATLDAVLVAGTVPELEVGITSAEEVLGRSGAGLAKKAYYLGKTTPTLTLATELALLKHPKLAAEHFQPALVTGAKWYAGSMSAPRLATTVLDLRLRAGEAARWSKDDNLDSDTDSNTVGYMPTSYTTRDTRAAAPTVAGWGVNGFNPNPPTPEDRELARRTLVKHVALTGGINLLYRAVELAQCSTTEPEPYQHHAPTTLQQAVSGDADHHVHQYQQHTMRLAVWRVMLGC